MKKLMILVAFVCLSTGCQKSNIKQVEAKQAIDISIEQDVRPIQFRKIVVKLERGPNIGTVWAGAFYYEQGPLTWRGKRLSLAGDEFDDVFR